MDEDVTKTRPGRHNLIVTAALRESSAFPTRILQVVSQASAKRRCIHRRSVQSLRLPPDHRSEIRHNALPVHTFGVRTESSVTILASLPLPSKESEPADYCLQPVSVHNAPLFGNRTPVDMCMSPFSSGKRDLGKTLVLDDLGGLWQISSLKRSLKSTSTGSASSSCVHPALAGCMCR